MTITQDDFKKIWASTSSVPEYTFSDADYQNGWEFVGNLPPTRAMWDTLQRRNDQKMKFLQDNGSMCFDSVADMVATDLEAGQTVITKGYYSVNDGGSALYTIREKDVSDVEDGGHIIFLDNDNVAEIIAPKDTAESYGIIAGSADYAESNSARIADIIDRENGTTILFGVGDYYFDDYIPMSRKGTFKGISMQKTVLHFQNSSGFKGDLTDSYIWGQYIGNMTIEADIPIDMSDITVREYYDSKFENLFLIGDDVCVCGTPNGLNPTNGTLSFNIKWNNIWLNSNNYGFKNLANGNTNYFFNIIDRGNTIKTLFYNVVGTFSNINCSYGGCLDYVWYFSASLKNTLGYTATVICYDSNLEDINKSFVYCEDEAYTVRLQFENVMFDTNTDVAGSTYPAIQVPVLAYIVFKNCDERYFAQTRASGISFIYSTRYNADLLQKLVVPDKFSINSQLNKPLKGMEFNEAIYSPFSTISKIEKFDGISANFFYGGKILTETELTVTAVNPTIPIGETYVINSSSTATRLTEIDPQTDNVGRKWARTAGTIITLVNKSGHDINCESYNTTTNYGFPSAFNLVAGESATFILQTNGTISQWRVLDYFSKA